MDEQTLLATLDGLKAWQNAHTEMHRQMATTACEAHVPDKVQSATPEPCTHPARNMEALMTNQRGCSIWCRQCNQRLVILWSR